MTMIKFVIGVVYNLAGEFEMKVWSYYDWIKTSSESINDCNTKLPGCICKMKGYLATMTYYLVTINGGIHDILTSFSDAIGSFRIAYRNRVRYARYIPEDVVCLECWKRQSPIPAECVWRYRPDWSRDYSTEEIEHLDIPNLTQDVQKYRRVIKGWFGGEADDTAVR